MHKQLLLILLSERKQLITYVSYYMFRIYLKKVLPSLKPINYLKKGKNHLKQA